jgi:hypothetical protein
MSQQTSYVDPGVNAGRVAVTVADLFGATVLGMTAGTGVAAVSRVWVVPLTV